MKMKGGWGRWVMAGVILLALLLIAGCTDDDDTTLIATLTGDQEVPPVVTKATGSGSVTIPDSENRLDAIVQGIGLSSAVIQAHIHFGRPGENGPVLFTLFDSAVDGTFPGQVSRQFDETDLETQPPGSPISTFAEALQAIRDGNTYFNIHTVNNPDGEIRGQIGARLFEADLSGGDVVPPVTTMGTGIGILVVARDRNTIGATAQVNDIDNNTVEAIVIRQGQPGENGPVLFVLYDVDVDGAFTGSATQSLTAANFVPQLPGTTIDTFTEAVSAIENGDTYLSVETTTVPSGELRGQLARLQREN